MCPGELGEFARRPDHTTAYVEEPISILDTNLRGEIVFMTGNGLVEGLPICEATEMERLAPTIFIEIRPEIVVPASTLAKQTVYRFCDVLSSKSCIFSFSCLGTSEK